MCKESIRIGRKTKRVSSRVAVLNGIGAKLCSANADRIAVIFALELDTTQNIAITGNIDPATGNVNETFQLNIRLWVRIGPFDGGSVAGAVCVTSFNPTERLTVERDGIVTYEELWAFHNVGINAVMNVTEIILEQPLENT